MKRINRLFIFFFVLAVVTISCTAEEKKPMADSKAADSVKPMGESMNANMQESADKFKFTTKDFDGNTVTDEIFSNYDLTLVNVWGTFCGPCIAEMPDLGKVYKTYKAKNCNIIAIAADVLLEQSPDALNLGKRILKDSGCDFKSLQMSESLMPIYSLAPAVPTSFFVNRKGEIVPGSLHSGRMTYAAFTNFLEENLKKVQK